MNTLSTDLAHILQGEVFDDPESIKKYSRDASLFEVKPLVVVHPKSVKDLTALVRYVNEHKHDNPTLSITARSAGTDMSGGALGESIVLDFTRYFTQKIIDQSTLSATVEPGVFYRDLEKETLPKRISLPVYPASKQLAALGGMVMNNAGGERTLRYGQIRDFVLETSLILRDGELHHFTKLNRSELTTKMQEASFEGELYRNMYELLSANEEIIEKARPRTSKNSAGYALWRIWDKKADTFDLSQLFVGSQGTLGLLTQAKMRLINEPSHRKLIAVFLRSWDDLAPLVEDILPFNPESMEVFDEETLKLGLRFLPEIAKKSGTSMISFALAFLPEVAIGIRMLGLPKLVVLIELAEESEQAISEKTQGIEKILKKRKVHARFLKNGPDSEKYWTMRRESFNLLRSKVRGKKTAPFIDDFVVRPEEMSLFLPELSQLLRDSGIKANIAGHAGNGNYHIIPLMDLSRAEERAKIIPTAKKAYDLILKYGGSITGEHNDGIIRTPFLESMFGPEMCDLFAKTKNIFDPDNIFNPGKKVGGTLTYAEEHIAH